MRTKKQYSHKKHTKKHFGGVSAAASEGRQLTNAIVDEPKVETWVSSEKLPGYRSNKINDILKSLRRRRFITYDKLLERVMKAVHILQSKRHHCKIINIAGSTTKPFEFVSDSKMWNHLCNRVTEFTIYYKKCKPHEPLDKPLHCIRKCFDNFNETGSMRKFLASWMQKHPILCHVDISGISSLTDTLNLKPGNAKITKTDVFIFYYKE